MKFNTIRFKISFLFVLILGATFCIYLSFLFITFQHTLYQDFDSKLQLKLAGINENLRTYLDNSEYSREEFIFSAWKIIDQEQNFNGYINFLDPKDEPVVSSFNMKSDLSLLLSKSAREDKSGKPQIKSIKYNGGIVRVMNAPFDYKGKEHYTVQIGISLASVISLLQTRFYYRLIPIPFILLLGFFIGRIFTRRMLWPVMEITRAAKSITYEGLNARVEAKDVDEEMRYLVDAFNDMISRLEKSFKYISEFSLYVAHELKTPLSIIRGESELALRKERDSEEYRRAIAVNLEESKRMFRIIEDLLLLTRLDYQPDIFKFERLDLADFFEEICAQSRTLAFGKDFRLTINAHSRTVAVKADKLHLRRLFFNLIDNAIKFTGPNGKISITVVSENNKAVCSVSDNGIGIEENDLPGIFEKFSRIEKKTINREFGSGLGLSIAQAIAKIHRGQISVVSKLGTGTTFSVTLPLV